MGQLGFQEIMVIFVIQGAVIGLFGTLLGVLGVGLVLVAVFLLSRTAENSGEFDRLQNVILAINIAGVFLLFILLVGNLARLWRDQGRRDDARNLLAPVYGWFTEGFATPDLQAAKELLDMLRSA